MSQPVSKALLEKFLRSECSPEEEVLVHNYLKKPESEAILNEILAANAEKDWMQFERETGPHLKSTQWLNAINQKISAQEQETAVPLKRHFPFKNAAIWAALVITSLSIYLITLLQKPQPVELAMIERSNPNGQRSKIILADSSVVYLGAGSRLRYPERFSAGKREISLYGEAFFEVTKNPKKPFIIHTGAVSTRVLGTSFKIEAFKNKPLTVEVATGKVRVDRFKAGRAESLAILTPGQRVVYFNGKAITRPIDVADVTGFKTAQLAFRNAALTEICETLCRWYNVEISFKNKRKSLDRMTLTIDATMPVDKLLNVLAAAGKFHYTLKNNTIIIR